MATEFIMPKLGLTMEEGTITEWLVADGDTVAAGTAVLRIETDKTETDVEAAESGRLHVEGRIGDTFACGQRIGWFLADGEDAPAGAPVGRPDATEQASADAPAPVAHVAPPAVAPGGRLLASPLAKRLAGERNIDLRAVRGTGPGGRIVAADLDDVPATSPTATSSPGGSPLASLATSPQVGGHGVSATTAARQLADLLGVDLGRVPADAHDGRVSRESVARYVRDVLNQHAERPAPAAAQAPAALPGAPALLPALQPPTRTIRMAAMRGTIAKRMHESLTQMAQLTLFMDAEFDAVVADRMERKNNAAAPSYTDYVIAAAARALTQHPLVNSQIIDEGVALLPAVHVGMAVALDDGLIVPVISDTASRDFVSLSAETTRLAQAARAGALKLNELEGGTFSVSTLGMFGVDGFTPVINPPNTAILGVGRLRDDVVLDGDGVARNKKRLTLSLTWDHRAFDGAPAAAFCRTIADLLEDPAALDQPVD